MSGLGNWRLRTFYTASLILVPFLRFIVRNEWGLAHPEVLAGAAILVVVSTLLALACRGIAFYALITLLVTVMSVDPAQQLVALLGAASPWLCAVIIAALTWLVARRMREKFFPYWWYSCGPVYSSIWRCMAEATTPGSMFRLPVRLVTCCG